MTGEPYVAHQKPWPPALELCEKLKEEAVAPNPRIAEIEERLRQLAEIEAELKAARRRYTARDWAAVVGAARRRKRLSAPVTRTRTKAKSKAGAATVAELDGEAALAVVTSAGVEHGGQELRQLAEAAYDALSHAQ